MYGVVLAVAWLVGMAYCSLPSFWLVAHPRAELGANRRAPYAVALLTWLAVLAAMGALTWPWHEVSLYRSPLAWAPGLVLIAAGLLIYPQALKDFGRDQLIGRPEFDPSLEQRLVTTGIRSRVRHPVYLAGLCELLGWTVGSGLAVLFVLTAISLPAWWLMIKLEDAELERRFGAQYRDYRRRVPALFPSFAHRAPTTATDETR